MADKKPIKITETVLRDAHQSLDSYSYDNRADASYHRQDG